MCLNVMVEPRKREGLGPTVTVEPLEGGGDVQITYTSWILITPRIGRDYRGLTYRENITRFLRYYSSSKINIGDRNVVSQYEGLSRSTEHCDAYGA